MEKDESRGFEQILEPLLEPRLILLGIRLGIFPPMSTGGFNLTEFVTILAALPIDAMQCKQTMEKWFWRQVGKKRRAGRQTKTCRADNLPDTNSMMDGLASPQSCFCAD